LGRRRARSGTGGSFDPEVVPVLLLRDFQAALPTVGRYTQGVFGEGVEIRVGDGIRTRDIQIHNLNLALADKSPKSLCNNILQIPSKVARGRNE
jgi:hypothetical protein